MKTCWKQLSVVAAVFALALTGCGGGGSNSELPDPEVRFVNGSPSTDNLDFLLNDAATAPNVAYLGATTDFQAVEFLNENEDGYDISVRRTGQTSDLDRVSTVLQRNTNKMLVAIGLQNPGSEPEKRLRLQLWDLDRTTPVGNKSRIFFLNAFLRSTGFETPPVTFQSVIPGDPTSIDNPQFKVENVAYGNNAVLTIDSGNRRFIVRRSDTQALVQYASQDFNFESGAIYLALMTGQEANPNPALQPRIQFIRMSTKD